jgi:Trm5-related predicted tRNA methylase
LSPEEQDRKRQQAQARIQERTAAKAETAAKLSAAAKDGPKLIIDLAFWNLMTPQEQKSLLSQLAFCAGLNKRAPVPFSLQFTRYSISAVLCMNLCQPTDVL